MIHSLRRGRPVAAVLISAAVFSACGDDGFDGEPTGSVESSLTQAERMVRYAQIRDAASTRGIDKTGYLLAGIAYSETNLAHCWSEATWACQGPNSADCGGPVIAGSADGPCSAQQGGLGMFQFDAGTYSDTINTYGADVLTVAGNTSHAIDYVINMVKISAYTTNAETDAKALQWINDFDINNGTLRDQWIKTVTRYYNGCQEGWSCWSARIESYNNGLQTVIDETGLPFWIVGPVDQVPAGYLDSAGCDLIRGWAQDPDTPGDPIDVHLYFDSVPGDANAKAIVVRADRDRQDLCAPLGSCNHAYEVAVPRSLLDGGPHTVRAYGINSSGGANPELAQSPATFQCSPPAAPVDAANGVRRWVNNPDVFASWKFSTFYDIAHISDADLQAYPQGEDWPTSPQLVQGDDGSPEVWSMDGSQRRHVLSMDDLNAWRFDTAAIASWPAAELSGYEEGSSWVSIPFLVQGSGAEVYVIDVAAPGVGGSAGAGGSAGTGGAAGSGGTGGSGLAGSGGVMGWPDASGGTGGGQNHGAYADSPDTGSCSSVAAPRTGWGWATLGALGVIVCLRRRRRS